MMFDEDAVTKEYHTFLHRMYILNQVVAVVMQKQDAVRGVDPNRLRAMVANYKLNGNPYDES